MPIHEMWFTYKLEVIEAFLRRALSVEDEYTHALDHDPAGEPSADDWECAGDILIGYYQIVVRAALNELNALVELELSLLARQHMGEIGKSKSRLTWPAIRRIVEREYDIDLDALPHAADVKRLHVLVNAYKHDDGFGVHTLRRYELEWDDAVSLLASVRGFLSALPGRRETMPEHRVKGMAAP
jgi:hypothetical protein